jgi:hypothetical protein
MDKFEINSPGPEYKPMTTADFQKEYGHIPLMCKTLLSNLHELFIVTDDTAKSIVDRTLSQVKKDLLSMSELIDRLIKENQVLSQQSQSAQSESKRLRQELDAARERNVQPQNVTCHLTASEIQLKMELLQVYQSKDRRIAELEEEIAQAKRSAAQQPSKIVATQKSRPSAASVTPENRTNGHKPVPEPIPIQLDNTSQFSTLQPDDIPAGDFFIISKDVERTDLGSWLILTNILNRDYGRVVGRWGQNAERLEQEYGVKINCFDGRQENFKLIISKGDADSRRAASDDIIENLPVVAQCPNLKTNDQALKNATFHCDVTINRTNVNNPGVTICGRLTNCRQAYYKLLLDNDDNIFHLE